MAEPSSLLNVVLNWINALSILSRPCTAPEDLSDGIMLFEILADVDSSYFRLVSTVERGDNWVFRFNNLKKMYKLVISYYEDVLHSRVSEMDTPNLSSIAKDSDLNEILKLASLILLLSVQCPKKEKFISAIQTLDEFSQQQIMLIISQMMQRLSGSASPTDMDDASHRAAEVQAEKEELEKAHRELIEEYQNLRHEHDTLVSEKQELRSRLNELEKSAAQASQSGKADFILKSEIEHLKQELEKSELRRHEAESLLHKNTSIVTELNRKVDELQSKADEAAILKDKVDELRHAADRLQKTEAVVEKYKKKLEETGDLRRQLQNLESQNAALVSKNLNLESEYLKLTQFKSLMDTYKTQISELESQKTQLQVEKSQMEYEFSESRKRMEEMEEGKRAMEESMRDLEEKIREWEFNGSAPRTLNQSLGQSLSSSSSAAETTELKLKIARLERKLAGYKASSTISGGNEEVSSLKSQVVKLEHLLEDANRSKTKFQQTLQLQSELSKLSSSNLSSSSRVSEEQFQELKSKYEQLKEIMGEKEKKLGDLNDQNVKLHVAMKKAKEFISNQDKTIKDLRSTAVENSVKTTENFPEAVQSLQSMLKMKEEELEELKTQYNEYKSQVTFEQKLILSAWYEAGMSLAKRGSGIGGQNPNGSSGTTSSTGGSSWLAQQRRLVASRR
ncbi:hook-related protein family [Paraphysoderma sedebokerense]|nr:hook-related protein family [Paraphysoderma sedebokerense]